MHYLLQRVLYLYHKAINAYFLFYFILIFDVIPYNKTDNSHLLSGYEILYGLPKPRGIKKNKKNIRYDALQGVVDFCLLQTSGTVFCLTDNM